MAAEHFGIKLLPRGELRIGERVLGPQREGVARGADTDERLAGVEIFPDGVSIQNILVSGIQFLPG